MNKKDHEQLEKELEAKNVILRKEYKQKLLFFWLGNLVYIFSILLLGYAIYDSFHFNWLMSLLYGIFEVCFIYKFIQHIKKGVSHVYD